ncbi:hypothetical protein BASA60_010365 [Batrachochytrium salamandrivorans]|nr:hypothetical protein BASA60_010365 [Batrachochytrium salamandrivorans]
MYQDAQQGSNYGQIRSHSTVKSRNASSRMAVQLMAQRMLLYTIGFVIAWTPSAVNRITAAVIQEPVFALIASPEYSISCTRLYQFSRVSTDQEAKHSCSYFGQKNNTTPIQSLYMGAATTVWIAGSRCCGSEPAIIFGSGL